MPENLYLVTGLELTQVQVTSNSPPPLHCDVLAQVAEMAPLTGDIGKRADVLNRA